MALTLAQQLFQNTGFASSFANPQTAGASAQLKGRITPTAASTSKGQITPVAASTSNGGGSGSNSGQPSAPSQPSAEDLARNAYFSELDRQAGLLPETQKNLESQVNNLFGSQQSSINTGLTSTLSEGDTSRANIDTNKVSSLRELDTNMRSQLQAGNIYLGARGAGDSSASNQYSFALSKVGSQNRAGVLKQANQLYAQVDQQMAKAKSLAQDELQKLETWKNNSLLQISQYIQGLKGQIDESKANYIQQKLVQLDSQASQYKQAIAQWILDRGTSLSQVQDQLKQLGVGPAVSFSQPQQPGLAFSGSNLNQGVDLTGALSIPKKQVDPLMMGLA